MNVSAGFSTGLFSTLEANGLDMDEPEVAPKENELPVDAGCPKGELAFDVPKPNPARVGFAPPFTSIPAPRVGLSSMLTSSSFPRGGVTFLTGVLVPKLNPFDTSVPLLPPEGVPKRLVEAGGAGAGEDEPNMNAFVVFFSGFGVEGADAPNVKGDLAGVVTSGGALGEVPKENGDAGIEDAGALPKRGFGAAMAGIAEVVDDADAGTVEADGPNVNGFGGSTGDEDEEARGCDPKPLSEGVVAAEELGNSEGFVAGACWVTSFSFSTLGGAPNEKGVASGAGAGTVGVTDTSVGFAAPKENGDDVDGAVEGTVASLLRSPNREAVTWAGALVSSFRAGSLTGLPNREVDGVVNGTAGAETLAAGI